MTDREKQDEAIRDYYSKHPFGEQDENGVDLSLLRENLKLTPTERMHKHNRALLFVRELQRAGQAYRDRAVRKTP